MYSSEEVGMTTTMLEQAQQLADQLTPLEQVRLLEYLTPQIARAMATVQAPHATTDPAPTDAWQEFFRLGDALAETDHPNIKTLTATVLEMRR
jgi:hypothetical protein